MLQATLAESDCSVDIDYHDEIIQLPTSLKLSCGRVLKQPRLAYRRIGQAHLPAIFVLGGISANRQVWQPYTEDKAGWWQTLIGHGQSIDTRQYQVLAFDFIGGAGQSESPNHYAKGPAKFPAISTQDQAQAIAALAEYLGIKQFESIIGASYGGMITLALCVHYPQLVKRAMVICADHAPTPIATGWRHVQREVVRFGMAHNAVAKGMQLARALAMTTYRSGIEFEQRFQRGLTQEGSCIPYLEHCGQQFAERFDPHAYLCLSASIDTHAIDLKKLNCPIDILGFDSDQLVPAQRLRELAPQLPPGSSVSIEKTIYGHDAFLAETDLIRPYISKHLKQDHTKQLEK